jgi:hypothetical protein
MPHAGEGNKVSAVAMLLLLATPMLAVEAGIHDARVVAGLCSGLDAVARLSGVDHAKMCTVDVIKAVGLAVLYKTSIPPRAMAFVAFAGSPPAESVWECFPQSWFRPPPSGAVKTMQPRRC